MCRFRHKAGIARTDVQEHIVCGDHLARILAGQAIALYEHKEFTEGIIPGINFVVPFGVENGNQLASALTDVVHGDAACPNNNAAFPTLSPGSDNTKAKTRPRRRFCSNSDNLRRHSAKRWAGPILWRLPQLRRILSPTTMSRCDAVKIDQYFKNQGRHLTSTDPESRSCERSSLAATLVVCLWLLGTSPASASPAINAGDIALRHDIQLLADHGILTGPVTTWPLSWGPILADLRRYESDVSEAAPVAAAIQRLNSRASWETRIGSTTFAASASGADEPMKIRGFENTPRELLEVGLGMDWTGERVAVSLNGQFADRSGGSTDSRVDGSMLGLAVGNWSVALSTLDRWWGPGWDGSLVLSSNARPIPAITFDRNYTDAFDTPWLRWLGPWDLSVIMGQLESDRVVPHALFFGMRFNFRPLPSLEIGLSRTAQWCGDGRPCDASVFSDLLLGQDNIGDDNIGDSNEPGNQLAGVDFRWSLAGMSLPAAVYGQFIGEDEAGGFPSRYIGQFGLEAHGRWGNSWSWRWFGEFAGTSCQFYETSEIYNCAYNHGIYQTGYRYRGSSIGHGADNDARVVSTGLTLVNADESQWRAMLRSGKLNRGPGPDIRNTITPVPMDLTSIDVSHRRAFRFGLIEVGLGYEQTETSTGYGNEGPRFHVQWRSSY